MASAQVFAIIVGRTFFASILQDPVDSVNVDGAGDFSIFVRIMLPLPRPILGTSAVLQLLTIKNSFSWPLVAVTKPLPA
jgi:ABC-type glycerol-3-phosphate transport system permease component